MIDPEEDKLRLARNRSFQKYVEMERQRRQKLQLKTISESETGKTSNTKENRSDDSHWNIGNKVHQDASQFEYVAKYQKEFDDGVRQQAASGDNNLNKATTSNSQFEDKKQSGSFNNQSNFSTTDGISTVDNNTINDSHNTFLEAEDLVYSLPKFRGRGRGGCISGRPVVAPRSVCKLEETSTALAPTIAGISPAAGAIPDSNFFDQEYTSSIHVGQLMQPYFRNYRVNTSLPIYSSRDFIISSINSYNVCIVDGATGCGKTTQVPMYILEDAILGKNNPNRPCPNIYVTQPRKIAARSIARRICDERGWELGTIVGYQVGLDKKVSPQTVLCFCTAGVLLQKLITEKTLSGFSHIVIDEAHERDADTDLLMMFIKNLMRTEKSFFRLIVMSATMDMEKLRSYFTCNYAFGHVERSLPALCHIKGSEDPKISKGNDISIIYLDMLRRQFEMEVEIPEFIYDEAYIFEICYRVAATLILSKIPSIDSFNESTKSTLVFLPGLAEITRLHRKLNEMGCPENIIVIPIHSSLSTNDQNRVFEPTRRGCRKVILATNIAESSITVKDVGFIIDFCLTKNLVKDPITRFPVLKLEWSTQDKATQRAGRTGRCCEGKVFRLVPSEFYNLFPKYALPELLVAPLELSVLRVKSFGMGELKGQFALVLDPPPLQEIRTAVLELKQIGALSSTYDTQLSDIDGDLTELGRIISKLPIDVHLSKLILIASLFDVMDDAIIIAASLSTNRTVIRHMYGDMFETYTNKFNWSKGSQSDLFINLDVYKEFRRYKDDQQKDQNWLVKWCENRLLDEKKLNEVSALVAEITHRLQGENIETISRPNLEERDRSEDELMLKIAISAAFYPNYFLNQDFEIQDVKKALCTLDPAKTLIVGNIPIDQCPLYCAQIVDQISKKIKNADIEYVTDNSRALLVFQNKDQPVRDNNSEMLIGSNAYQKPRAIDLSVYLGIKYSESEKLVCREYQSDAAYTRMKYYKEYKQQVNLGNRLPPPWMKIIRQIPGKSRLPDNSRLTNPTNEEYEVDFYMEVPFNESQDRGDRDHLRLFEMEEDRRAKLSQDSNIKFPPNKIFKECRRLRGPYSPVQMTFYPLLQKSKGYRVEVDHLSINSILLDPEYQQKKCQMLVAASVGHNKANRLVARDTTLLPRVKGLPTVLALMFAQYYRVIFNDRTKCISGAIFGLGWDEADQPICKDYEVELEFDIHLTTTDIKLINECRRIISDLIRTIDVIQNPGAPRHSMQKKLRDIIMAIIRRKRYPLFVPKTTDSTYYDKSFFIKDRHNVPKQQLEKLSPKGTRIFLPLMESTLNLRDLDMYDSIRNNLTEFSRIQTCQVKPPLEGIRCLLCANGRGCFFQMHNKIVQHLNSDDHLEKLEIFEKFEQRAREIAQMEENENCE